MPRYTIVHKSKVVRNDNYIYEYDSVALTPPFLFQSTAWFDFSAATASTDTNSKNTVSSWNAQFYDPPFFQRAFNFGTTSIHLVAQNYPNFGQGKNPKPFYDNSVDKYICKSVPATASTNPNVGIMMATGQYNANWHSGTNSKVNVFLVIKLPNDRNQSDAIYAPNTESQTILMLRQTTVNFQIGHVNNTHLYAQLAANKSASIVETQIGFTSSNSTWYLISASYSNNMTDSTNTVALSMKVNGTTASATITSQPIQTGTWGDNQAILNQPFNTSMSFAEVVIYNSHLSNSRIKEVEDYLKYKWKISYL